MQAGEILSWTEVQQIHRIRNGVYQRGGRLISLLTDFGRHNPCYPDRFGVIESTEAQIVAEQTTTHGAGQEATTTEAASSGNLFESSLPATIFYTGAGRRGDQGLSPANRALFAAIESGHAVPLFNKLEVGRWQFMSWWRVAVGALAASNHNAVRRV